MKNLDVTIDFEALALNPTAAPMSLAAVAWNRDSKNVDGTNTESVGPFIFRKVMDEDGNDIGPVGILEKYQCGIDVRSCIIEGMDVSRDTLKWWSNQSKESKGELLVDEPVWLSCAIENFFSWVKEIKVKCNAETVCLWSQGSDYDIAILRNICSKLDIDMSKVFDHHNFRDCRSVICENMQMIKTYIKEEGVRTVMEDYNEAYKNIPELPSWVEGSPHSPLYDCIRSTWNTWQSMNMVRSILESV